MNRPIRKVAVALGVMLAALFVNINFVQVVKSNAYDNTDKYADNRLPILAEYSSPRGQIDVQGTAIAKSVSTSDELKYLRVYADGPIYAPVTGFNSIIYGTDGIESAKDKVLSGTDPRQFSRKIADLFTGRNPTGGNVELTLNKAAQQAAYDAMKTAGGVVRRGAVVALDPTTGAILALVSTPSYDPNKLSSHDSNAITQYYQLLQNDPAQPMLDRALKQTYTPRIGLQGHRVGCRVAGQLQARSADRGAERLLAVPRSHRRVPERSELLVRPELRRRDVPERHDSDAGVRVREVLQHCLRGACGRQSRRPEDCGRGVAVRVRR